jgi:hypothetical protein
MLHEASGSGLQKLSSSSSSLRRRVLSTSSYGTLTCTASHACKHVYVYPCKHLIHMYRYVNVCVLCAC